MNMKIRKRKLLVLVDKDKFFLKTIRNKCICINDTIRFINIRNNKFIIFLLGFFIFNYIRCFKFIRKKLKYALRNIYKSEFLNIYDNLDYMFAFVNFREAFKVFWKVYRKVWFKLLFHLEISIAFLVRHFFLSNLRRKEINLFFKKINKTYKVFKYYVFCCRIVKFKKKSWEPIQNKYLEIFELKDLFLKILKIKKNVIIKKEDVAIIVKKKKKKIVLTKEQIIMNEYLNSNTNYFKLILNLWFVKKIIYLFAKKKNMFKSLFLVYFKFKFIFTLLIFLFKKFFFLMLNLSEVTLKLFSFNCERISWVTTLSNIQYLFFFFWGYWFATKIVSKEKNYSIDVSPRYSRYIKNLRYNDGRTLHNYRVLLRFLSDYDFKNFSSFNYGKLKFKIIRNYDSWPELVLSYSLINYDYVKKNLFILNSFTNFGYHIFFDIFTAFIVKRCFKHRIKNYLNFLNNFRKYFFTRYNFSYLEKKILIKNKFVNSYYLIDNNKLLNLNYFLPVKNSFFTKMLSLSMNNFFKNQVNINCSKLFFEKLIINFSKNNLNTNMYMLKLFLNKKNYNQSVLNKSTNKKKKFINEINLFCY